VFPMYTVSSVSYFMSHHTFIPFVSLSLALFLPSFFRAHLLDNFHDVVPQISNVLISENLPSAFKRHVQIPFLHRMRYDSFNR
jgi:hypothetical protein